MRKGQGNRVELWERYKTTRNEYVRIRREEKISEEQGGFRKERGCVDQIFSFRMVVEKMLAKGN